MFQDETVLFLVKHGFTLLEAETFRKRSAKRQPVNEECQRFLASGGTKVKLDEVLGAFRWGFNGGHVVACLLHFGVLQEELKTAMAMLPPPSKDLDRRKALENVAWQIIVARTDKQNEPSHS